MKVDMRVPKKNVKGLAKANALFVNNNERLFWNASKIKKLPDYEDFTCHATPDVFQIDLVGKGDEKDFIDISPQEYAKRIKNSSAYKGGNIFLTDNDILAQMWYASDDKKSFRETGRWIVSAPSAPKSTLSKLTQVAPHLRFEIPLSRDISGFSFPSLES